MSELRRLGRREAYRLGTLRTQGVSQPAPPRPSQPSFLPRHQGSGSAWALSFLGGTAAITAAAELGLWFVPLLVGLLAGVCGRLGRWPSRVTLPAAAAMAVIGWGIPLGLAARHGHPAGAVLLGMPAHSMASIAVPLLTSAIEALAGAYLGRAIAPSVGQWLWPLTGTVGQVGARPGVTRSAFVTDHGA